MEWEALSLNVRRHPLSRYRTALGDLGVIPSQEACSLPHGNPYQGGRAPQMRAATPDPLGTSSVFSDGRRRARPVAIHGFPISLRALRSSALLRSEAAFLLEGRIEQDSNRGFSFVVERIEALAEVLLDVSRGSTPKSTVSGTQRRGRSRRRAVG